MADATIDLINQGFGGEEDGDLVTSMGLPNGASIRSQVGQIKSQITAAEQSLQSQISAFPFTGNENNTAVQAMRNRGVNVGYDDLLDIPQGALDLTTTTRMQNGVARRTGRQRNQIFGGE